MSIRGVPQLKKLTVRFCKHGGSSTGTRDFLAAQLPTFASKHSTVEFVVEQRSNKHPIAIGEYVNGNSKVEDLKNKSLKEVQVRLDNLANTSGAKILKRPEVSGLSPSIQGVWTPATTFTEFTLKL